LNQTQPMLVGLDDLGFERGIQEEGRDLLGGGLRRIVQIHVEAVRKCEVRALCGEMESDVFVETL